MDKPMVSGPYLGFSLHGGLYAVPASCVREIFWLPELTPTPEAPDYVRGIVDLRGQIVPVIDAGIRLGYAPQAFTMSDVVIALDAGQDRVGIVASEVHEVWILSSDTFEPAGPTRGMESPALTTRAVIEGIANMPVPEDGALPDRFILGHCRIEDRIVAILDVDRVVKVPAIIGRSIPPVALPDPGGNGALDQALLHERALALRQAAEVEDRSEAITLAVVSMNGELFGFDLGTVREFSTIQAVTPIPCCPPYVVGAVNLRGEILTLVDIRDALQMSRGAAARGGRVMVVQVDEVRAGLVIDEVLDVIQLRHGEMTTLPAAARALNEEYMNGTTWYRNRAVSVVDLPHVFARADWLVDETV